MEKITEEQGVHTKWYEEAKEQTMDSLPKFLDRLMNEYGHDYGTICHAFASGAIGTMWAMNKHDQGGITGFQAGAIMWEVIRHWNFSHNKTGLRIVDFDNLLYPQYKETFDRKISPDTWRLLQEEASKKMQESNIDHVNQHVYDHWSSIVDGKVPFGFTVKND